MKVMFEEVTQTQCNNNDNIDNGATINSKHDNNKTIEKQKIMKK